MDRGIAEYKFDAVFISPRTYHGDTYPKLTSSEPHVGKHRRPCYRTWVRTKTLTRTTGATRASFRHPYRYRARLTFVLKLRASCVLPVCEAAHEHQVL